MLKSITIENLKPFGNGYPVRLAPITLVYGPNSSGKSSLIQSLLLIRQTLTEQGVRSKNDLITSGSFVKLGSFLSLLHRHDKTLKLKLGFEFAPVPKDLPAVDASNVDPCLGLALVFSANSYGRDETLPLLEVIEFDANKGKGERFSFVLKRLSPKPTRIQIFDVSDIDNLEDDQALGGTRLRSIGGDFGIRVDSDFDSLFGALQGSISKEEGSRSNKVKLNADSVKALGDLIFRSVDRIGLDKTYLPSWPALSPQSSETAIDQRLLDAMRSLVQRFDIRLLQTVGSLTYLGPLRTHPERIYAIHGMPEGSVGSQGERAIQILYHDAAVSPRGHTLIDRLNTYCERLQIPYLFAVTSIGNEITGDMVVLSLTDRRTNVKVAPTDVGFGIGQILPILIEGMVAQESGRHPRIVCVEQPEIHLHPRMQATMADFFIDTAATAKRTTEQKMRRGVQWILETHSEALVLRIQRRIREGTLSAQDISVLYVDPRGERGSIIEELRLDDDGEFIDEWPGGFFAESFNEVFGGR